MSSGPDMQKTNAAELTKLRERIRELELAEEGAQEAFAAVVQQKRQSTDYSTSSAD